VGKGDLGREPAIASARGKGKKRACLRQRDGPAIRGLLLTLPGGNILASAREGREGRLLSEQEIGGVGGISITREEFVIAAGRGEGEKA